LSWKFEQALELIKGKILKMVAPSRTHQKLSWRLSGAFFNHLKNHPCEAYAAPFDVRFYNLERSKIADKDIFDVVQPDLCVICDLKKLDERGCLGAPDLMVEILSPSNSTLEMKIKKQLYAEHGVREYWIVNSTHENVTRFNLEEDGNFGRPLIFDRTDCFVSVIFPDFSMELVEFFPAVEEVLE
jgi:Uma2 family endonuclease